MPEPHSGNLPMLVDPASEIMALSNYGDAKNIVIVGCDLAGILDEQAMSLALAKALESFPVLLCRVKETRLKGRPRFIWVRDPDHGGQLQISDFETPDGSLSFQDSFLRNLAGSLGKDWDLIKSAPTEFRLLRHARNRHSFFLLVHHAAADGWTGTGFLGELLANYHRIVTGRPPQGAEEGSHTSAMKNSVVTPGKPNWSGMRMMARHALNCFMDKPTFPKGTGDPVKDGEYYVKTVLTVDETKAIREASSKAQATFVDLLVWGVNMAVDKWNAEMNIRPGTINVSVSVQMRGRYGESDTPMGSSAIVLRFPPTLRTDPEALVGAIADNRARQFSDLADVKALQAAEKMCGAVGRLPLSARRRLIHGLCQGRNRPILVGSLGILWPKLENGRFSQDSYLTNVGGLEVTEAHIKGYAFAVRNPLRLVAHTFNGKLNLLLWVCRGHFTRAEATRFLNLFVQVLRENPFAGGN